MPYRLGGYFMDYATARHLASNLHINVDQGTILGYDNVDWDNTHMRFPFNDWFRRNNHLHMKAVQTDWPLDNDNWGLAIISTFHRFPHNQDPGDLPEAEADRKVKEWLVANGAADLQWVSFVDTDSNMLDGTEPQLTKMFFIPATGEQMREKMRKSREAIEQWKRETGYQSIGHYLREQEQRAAEANEAPE